MNKNTTYAHTYKTHDGFDDIMMNSDGNVLTGLWFINSPDESKHRSDNQNTDLPIFDDTDRWLDIYFSGRQPNWMPHYRIDGLTPFRKEVTDIMLTIPFGETLTYGEIAAVIAQHHGIPRMSSRAVGGAVGWNPICIIVPCHRIIGAGGKLTGYGGGLHNKIALLALEGIIKK